MNQCNSTCRVWVTIPLGCLERRWFESYCNQSFIIFVHFWGGGASSSATDTVALADTAAATTAAAETAANATNAAADTVAADTAAASAASVSDATVKDSSIATPVSLSLFNRKVSVSTKFSALTSRMVARSFFNRIPVMAPISAPILGGLF
jgi:hypothetical protein